MIRGQRVDSASSVLLCDIFIFFTLHQQLCQSPKLEFPLRKYELNVVRLSKYLKRAGHLAFVRQNDFPWSWKSNSQLYLEII